MAGQHASAVRKNESGSMGFTYRFGNGGGFFWGLSDCKALKVPLVIFAVLASAFLLAVDVRLGKRGRQIVVRQRAGRRCSTMRHRGAVWRGAAYRRVA